jgi:hypothetical protein
MYVRPGRTRRDAGAIMPVAARLWHAAASNLLRSRSRHGEEYHCSEHADGRNEGNMLRIFSAFVFGAVFFGGSLAWADDCYPHCDFWHDYGPYDFTYIRPGLYGYPICGPLGDCSPHLGYVYPGGYRYRKSITVRSRSRAVSPPRP